MRKEEVPIPMLHWDRVIKSSWYSEIKQHKSLVVFLLATIFINGYIALSNQNEKPDISVKYFLKPKCNSSKNNFPRPVYFDSDGYLHSALSPNLRWCSRNPFLKFYDSNAIFQLEQQWINWREHQLISTLKVLTDYGDSGGISKDGMADLMYPSSLPLPCPFPNNFTRVGGDADGSKAVCGLEAMQSIENCVIYSLGSLNDFKFEKDIMEKTSCTVYTYDCTSNPPLTNISRLSFHPICLGDANRVQKYMYPYVNLLPSKFLENASLFERFHVLMGKNAHSEVHFLKMDIEGGEYSVFADFSDPEKNINLPYQIAFESHWWNHDIYHAILNQKLFAQLWQMGYRVTRHEYNLGDRSCIEWNLIRVFC